MEKRLVVTESDVPSRISSHFVLFTLLIATGSGWKCRSYYSVVHPPSRKVLLHLFSWLFPLVFSCRGWCFYPFGICKVLSEKCLPVKVTNNKVVYPGQNPLPNQSFQQELPRRRNAPNLATEWTVHPAARSAAPRRLRTDGTRVFSATIRPPS